MEWDLSTQPEIVIDTVDGWAPHTRLYRIDSTYWLISVIDIVAVHDAVSEIILPHVLPVPDRLTGHTEIYEAAVDFTPIYEWVPDREVTDPPPQDECESVEDGDTLTITHHGDTVCILTRTHIRDDMHITPIDADGDPLNGLTPRWVLPAGTTFDQALDHITTHHEEH